MEKRIHYGFSKVEKMKLLLECMQKNTETLIANERENS